MNHHKTMLVVPAAMVLLTVIHQVAQAQGNGEGPGHKQCARQLATFNKCIDRINARLDKGACSEISFILKWRKRLQGDELSAKVEECVETCEAKLGSACDALEKSYDKCNEDANRAAENAKVAQCRKRWGADATIQTCDAKDAEKAKVAAESARLAARNKWASARIAKCRERWGRDTTEASCAAKTASEAKSQEEVRAAEALGKGTFHDNGDGTVTQDAAGLVWQQADSGAAGNWTIAAGYCATLALAGGGWRLPGVEESLQLMDISPSRPGGHEIDPVFVNTAPFESRGRFNTCDACGYWTATPFSSDSGHWQIHNQAGDSSLASVVGEQHLFWVRCVRGATALQRRGDAHGGR